jgi:hypothetical protein
MIRRAVLMLLALAVAGSGVACGGGGDSGKTDRSGSSSSDTEPGQIGDASTAKGETGDAATAGAPAPGGGAPTNAPGDVGTALETDYTFTGEGHEAFCGQMADLQASYQTADPDTITYATVAEQLAAITPPPELAADWSTFVDVQRTLAADQDQDLSETDPDRMSAYTTASAKVSVYLTDVCGL